MSGRKALILMVLATFCLFYISCEDDFFTEPVLEQDLNGVYAIRPYKVIEENKKSTYFDTLVIERNGTLKRKQYKDGDLIINYSGNWRYLLDHRYSISIDKHGNDVKPERNWIKGEIRIKIPTLTYYKLD